MSLTAQTFHNAPASATESKDPYAGQQDAVTAGAGLYAVHCVSCHGPLTLGAGNMTALASSAALRSATDGELFWFITKGEMNQGMPSWGKLPKQQRWQIVGYLKSAPSAPVGQVSVTPVANIANAPQPPFTDYRFEKPGTFRKITVNDLPAPNASRSADNGPRVVARPPNAWPQAPGGFKVEQYATGLNNPRLIRTAPNGDFFVAEMDGGDIRVFRGITADGKPKQMEVFASGLTEPYGIAFYPPGPNPQWLYVGDTDAVLRFPYKNGDLKAAGKPQHLADLPHGEGHSTRDIQFSLDGRKMFVAVGSASNVDDPDTHPDEKNRADILEFNPDGSGMRIYAWGIRNAGGGLAVNPQTGEMWCSINERDEL